MHVFYFFDDRYFSKCFQSMDIKQFVLSVFNTDSLNFIFTKIEIIKFHSVFLLWQTLKKNLAFCCTFIYFAYEQYTYLIKSIYIIPKTSSYHNLLTKKKIFFSMMKNNLQHVYIKRIFCK